MLCALCKKDKELSEFYLRKDTGSHRKQCIPCIKGKRKSKYHEDKPLALAKQKESYLRNRGKRLESHRKYYVVNKEKAIWKGAKTRAKVSGIPFNIEETDIRIPKYCPYLGIELKKDNRSIQDNSPTLDRIKPELGYTKGNVEVISNRANKIKNDATPEELRLIYKRLGEIYEQNL